MSRPAPATTDAGSQAPARAAQRVFRAIMGAMAEPGRVTTLPVVGTAAPLQPASVAILLALCDFETTLWLAPEYGGAADAVRFQTGVRLVAAPAEAAFAVARAADLDLMRFAAGTPAYPDRGATVIVEAPALSGGPVLTLAGPGIATTTSFAVAGLPVDFARQVQANRARFPLGVDLVFACGSSIVALPRSTRIVSGAA